MRFLLVDRIVELDSGRLARGIKNLAMSEDYLTHHFPNSPIMPGALIMESLIQLSGWLIRESTGFLRSGIIDSVESMRFQRLVRPGDQLVLEVELLELTEPLARFKTATSCRGKGVAKGRIRLRLVNTADLEDVNDARAHFEVLSAGKEDERW